VETLESGKKLSDSLRGVVLSQDLVPRCSPASGRHPVRRERPADGPQFHGPTRPMEQCGDAKQESAQGLLDIRNGSEDLVSMEYRAPLEQAGTCT
jgi:hypothetical protein